MGYFQYEVTGNGCNQSKITVVTKMLSIFFTIMVYHIGSLVMNSRRQRSSEPCNLDRLDKRKYINSCKAVESAVCKIFKISSMIPSHKE